MATLGYVVREHADWEPDFEKIALFADADGTPSHAARQFRDGTWTSKRDMLEDMQHALEDLTGDCLWLDRADHEARLAAVSG